MKITDIVSESTELDEDLKRRAALGGIGAAIAGAYRYNKGSDEPVVKQDPTKDRGKVNEPPKPKNPADFLKYMAEKAGMKGDELSQFMAHAAHETGDFKHLVEQGTKDYFIKKYDKAHSPKTAKILGNIEHGDGIKFRGRGFLHITGRYNYKIVGKALGLPLEQKPELLEDMEIAAKASIWFWNHRVKPNVDDFGDIKQVTKKINPALKGMADRIKKLAHWKDNK